jgi:hypothetical protein
MRTRIPDETVLLTLLKETAAPLTITTLAQALGISRVGAWKTLKRMQADKLCTLTTLGTGKTNALLARPDWDNPLTGKLLSLALTRDAVSQKRWMHAFAEPSKHVDFLLLYGSALRSMKDAGDIDIIGVTSKERMLGANDALRQAQKSQHKHIHALLFTPKEFAEELRTNKAFIDAVRTGVVIHGQDEFVAFMRGLQR